MGIDINKGIHKLTNEELFIQEIDKHWVELKNNEDTIFENIEISINAEDKFQLLKNQHQEYMNYISEDSVYEKKKIIKEYFWDRIVGDLYESTLDIMSKAGLLEESTKSFEHSYKIEETARLILENGIFARFPTQKKKEYVDVLIESSFYPATFAEKRESYDFLEEGIADSLRLGGQTFGRYITNTARTTKSLSMLLSMFLVSPATLIMSQFAKQGADTMGVGGARGTSPSMRKFYEMLDKLSPVNHIYTFLNKDQQDLYKYLKQSNNLENDYIQDVLKTAGADSGKMVEKCWNQNKIQIEAKDRDHATLMEKVKHLLSGKGLANILRDPMYNNENQLMLTLGKDAADPIYQKRFYDFRVCVYDKLFEVILGYAKAIYSMDDESYEVIKAANDAHQTKNYKAFFDLKPKQDNDAAMFAIMKALVSIDSIARTLEKSKGDLAADKQIDKFSSYLTQNIKQVYNELDEMANQRKFNADRYDEEDGDDDETKAKKMAEERFNQKKSIFAD